MRLQTSGHESIGAKLNRKSVDHVKEEEPVEVALSSDAECAKEQE
jgi:hypothetical protein